MKRFKPSKKQAAEFAAKMKEIEIFCNANGISQSLRGDSYYFTLNGICYRVSNHTIEASNVKAFNEFGEQIRDIYHPNGRDTDTVYITASKTRIIEIYNDLKNGFELDKRGNRKGQK